MPIHYDDSHHPLVVVTVYGVLTDDEYRAHLTNSDKLVKRGERYTFVFDGMLILRMQATQRRLQSEWINKNREAVSKLNLGCGFAMTLLTRGVLTSVHWVSPPPYPYKLCGSREDAIRWCAQQIRAGGGTFPGKEEDLFPRPAASRAHIAV